MNQIEGTVVDEIWNFRTGGGRLFGINFRKRNPRLITIHFGNHLSPRIDDERMAKGFPPICQIAALGGGNKIGTIFDRPGTQKGMPVRPACLACETG